MSIQTLNCFQTDLAGRSHPSFTAGTHSNTETVSVLTNQPPETQSSRMSPYSWSRGSPSLHCRTNCECRCHGMYMQALIPTWLACYIGQLYISKTLFRAPWSTWSLCTVRDCRGDLRRAMTINWILPPNFLSGCLRSSQHRRIHVAIGAAKTIPWGAPVLTAITDANVKRVRDLFALGQASIWDHNPDGSSILWVNQIICQCRLPRMMLTFRYARLHVNVGCYTPAMDKTR